MFFGWPSACILSTKGLNVIPFPAPHLALRVEELLEEPIGHDRVLVECGEHQLGRVASFLLTEGCAVLTAACLPLPPLPEVDLGGGGGGLWGRRGGGVAVGEGCRGGCGSPGQGQFLRHRTLGQLCVRVTWWELKHRGLKQEDVTVPYPGEHGE